MKKPLETEAFFILFFESMRNCYIIVYFLMTLISLGCSSKSEKEIEVEKFITCLLDDSISAAQVATFFENTSKDDELIARYVTEIRTVLKEQSIKFEDLRILPYSEAEEQLKFITKREKGNIFGVLRNGQLVFPVLINDEKKIVTCTAINMGGRGYFLIL